MTRLLRSSRRAAPTSYDVAQLAGVSQSAVSRCFRTGASISDDKRTRVLSAARKLGYSPDAIARSLTTKRSNLIGVIISNQTILSYPEVLSELNACCEQRDVQVLLFTLQREGDIDAVLERVWQYRLDGVIAAAGLTDSQVRSFQRRNVALVFFNRFARSRAVNAVGCDQLHSATMLVDVLCDTGHTCFGLIGGPSDSVVGNERIAGCVERLQGRGSRHAIVSGDFSYAGGRSAFSQLHGILGRSPDAVIAANDVMALGCIDAVRFDHGLNVPADVSVVGFDGVDCAAWKSYELTVIRQPIREMAQATVGLLMECIEHPGRSPQKKLFTGELVHRHSARLNLSE